MSSKNEILDRIAREGHIERMVRAIYKRDTPELGDLIQDTFLQLLKKPEEVIVKADAEGWLPFLCLNIVRTMVTSNRSPFYKECHRFSHRSREITEDILNIPDDNDR